jgi:pimeloyl-ACP methyl ester carboxylesterase
MIETLNGVRIYLEVHGAGEPVVLLHGFSDSSQDWSSVVALSMSR